MLARATVVLATLFFLTGSATSQRTTRVSVSSLGQQALGGHSNRAVISPDGRYAAFESEATNLAPDSNARRDVFLHDRLSGNTQRVSIAHTGAEANNHCFVSDVSDDGRFVFFLSSASNLVGGDTNGKQDAFRRDVVAGTTIRVSVGTGNVEANDDSIRCDASSDGNLVVFSSYASNLVTPDLIAGDIYLRDISTGVTVRVSRSTAGVQANNDCFNPRISSDGGWIVFSGSASNLVPGDLNAVQDIFLFEVATGTLSSVTVDPNSLIGNNHSTTPDVSDGGGFVVFASSATNFASGDSNGSVDVFLWERQSASFLRISNQSNGTSASGSSLAPVIAADSTDVAFQSNADNLVPGDTNGAEDIFRYRTGLGVLERVSVNETGQQSNGSSFTPSISADGNVVAMYSQAFNLVAGDTNSLADSFVRAPACSTQVVYCTAKTNSNGCVPVSCSSGAPSLSGASTFTLRAYRLLNQKSGFLFWSYSANAVPFGGGIRCVGSPARRTTIQNSGGSTTTNDCSGEYSYDFTPAYMATWGLVSSQHIFAQWWSRDPFLALPDNVGLTDAIEFVIEP